MCNNPQSRGICRTLSLIPLASVFVFASHKAHSDSWETVSAIFDERCVACHSGEFAPLGLSLDSYQSLTSGSENGSIINIEFPDQSALIHRLTGEAEPRMPLDGPPYLYESEIGSIRTWIAAGALGPDSAGPIQTAEPLDPYSDRKITYDEVANIFGKHCVICHSENGRYDTPPEALRLSSLDEILTGGDRVVVIPGNAQASEIIRRIEGLSLPRMPFDGPPWLSDVEIQLLRDWIDGGALSSESVPAQIPVGAELRLRGVLTGTSEIDGVSFVMTSNADVEVEPQIGDRVEVRGYIGQSGEITAQRVRDR